MSEADRDRPRGQLLEEAAAWFARMRGPDAEASRGEFEAWLAQGALHRSAYNRASEIFAMGKLLQDPEIEHMPSAVRPTRRRMLLVGTIAAVGLAAGTGWIGLHGTGEPRKGEATLAAQRPNATGPLELASQAREGAVFRLGDGSEVILAAATRLKVDIEPQARNLVLEAGEARFKVAHEARPFIVQAGGGSIIARGTVFDVALSPDRRVRVHLIEGVIDVSAPAPSPIGPARRLVAGQSTSFAVRDAGQPSGKSGASSHEAADLREFDGARLGDVIDAANRGSERPIRTSSAIGERRVSGRFRIDDTDLLAERIAALLDLTVDRADPSAILLKAH